MTCNNWSPSSLPSPLTPALPRSLFPPALRHPLLLPPPAWNLSSMCERAATSRIQLCSRMFTSCSPVLGHHVRVQSHKHGNTRSPKLGGVGLKIGGDKSMQNNGGGGLAEAPPRKCSKSVPVSQSSRRRSTHSRRPGNCALTLTAKRHN